ncbi:MAG: hypothetical protein LBU11_08280 [Zoogloeaceae bacterium]|nr:hypothetical protein [Zoogloeaceae bacterium]
MQDGFSHRDVVFELGVKYKKNYRSIERILNRSDQGSEGATQQALF